MKLFRNRKDGELYRIFYVSPWKILGRWYEAEPLFPSKGKKVKHAKLEDFEVVCDDCSLENCEKLKNKIKSKKIELKRLQKEIKELEQELSKVGK